MRNLIVIAKVIPGVNHAVDAVIERLSSVRDLNDLMSSEQTGGGLIYWASYYDPWLMGDDLGLNRLELQTDRIADGVVEVSVAEQTWHNARRASSEKAQWREQDWLSWHLIEAFDMFRNWNSKARLFFGREVLGTSLLDSEVWRAAFMRVLRNALRGGAGTES
jgi:hypothetical protein